MTEGLNKCIKCPTGTMRIVREKHKMEHVLLGPFNEILAVCQECGATRYFCRQVNPNQGADVCRAIAESIG